MRAQTTSLRHGRPILWDSSAVDLMTLEQFRVCPQNRGSLRVHPFHTGGWVVAYNHRGLATQRGQLRVFKTMDAVCKFMSDERIHVFEVSLSVVKLVSAEDLLTYLAKPIGGAA